MPRKKFSAEQIIAKLRQVEVLTAQGQSVAQTSREAGISEQSYLRWLKEYGGLMLSQAKPFTAGLPKDSCHVYLNFLDTRYPCLPGPMGIGQMLFTILGSIK